MLSEKAMESKNERNGMIYSFFKRFVDIVGSSVALVVFVLPFAIIAILIKRVDHGPVFFKQTRIGKNGKPFKMYKFRSMVVNAEQKMKEDPKLYQKYIDNGYKLPEGEDPRVTGIGRLMRKTSIDELPQFINILKGDMSIVGPRPVVKGELANYGDRIDEFLSVKPGAMGLWQASGRSNITYPERCDVELDYIRNASFFYDIKIFFMTLASIFKGDGAF